MADLNAINAETDIENYSLFEAELEDVVKGDFKALFLFHGMPGCDDSPAAYAALEKAALDHDGDVLIYAVYVGDKASWELRQNLGDDLESVKNNKFRVGDPHLQSIPHAVLYQGERRLISHILSGTTIEEHYRELTDILEMAELY